MKIDFNRLNDLNAKMSVVIEYADYGPKLEENIRKYSKKVALKGFRAGKTPKSVLTKMYGKGMLEETIQALLNEQMTSYFEKEKINLFGTPLLADTAEPQDFNINAQHDYTFQFDLGLKPDFEIQYNRDSPLSIQVPEMDPSLLDEDILRYRRALGTDTPVTDQPVEAFDRVTVKLSKINDDKTIDTHTVETTLHLDHLHGEGQSTLPGKKIGDELDVDLEKFTGYKREEIVKNILEIEQDPAPDSPLMYKATIVSIMRPQTTELTSEQLEKVTRGQTMDETGFREMLERREKDELNGRAEDMKKMTVRWTLIQANPFELPEEFLLRWLNQQREKPIEAGSRQAKNLFRDMKWSHLLDRIASTESLQVTEQDVRKQVTNWVIQNANYMQTDVRKLMEQLYANEYFMSSMRDNALEEVVFNHLLPTYTFTEEAVTKKEFEKAFHDVHHELFDHEHHDHDHDHHHDHDHAHHDHSHSH